MSNVQPAGHSKTAELYRMVMPGSHLPLRPEGQGPAEALGL